MKHLLLTTIAAVVLVGCGPSGIHKAAANGNIEAVKQHLADGADVNAKDDKFGRTPLQFAAKDGHKEIVELLIAEGAGVNAKKKGESTPLHNAAWGGNKEIIELLIAEGADVNAKGLDRWTPLHSAIGRGHKEVAELLIAKGADVNAKVVSGQHKGRTPLDRAIFLNRTETADLLREHGGKTGAELKAEGK